MDTLTALNTRVSVARLTEQKRRLRTIATVKEVISSRAVKRVVRRAAFNRISNR